MDEFEKTEVSSECCDCQTAQSDAEMKGIVERISVSKSRINVIQANESKKNGFMPAKDFICESRVNVVLDEDIQCDDGKIWFHYICSKLPLYKLYIYEIFHRTKRCEICSSIDTGFYSFC